MDDMDKNSIVNFSVFASNEIYIQLSDGDPRNFRYDLIFGWSAKKSVIRRVQRGKKPKYLATVHHGKDKFIEVKTSCNTLA